MAVLNKVPASITKVPSSETKVPSAITGIPTAAGTTLNPSRAAGGNTTNVVAVGATGATTTAINDANNKVQVGA